MSEQSVTLPETQTSPPSPPGSGRRWVWIPVALIFLVAAYVVWAKTSQRASTRENAPAVRSGDGKGPAVPSVVVTRARIGNIGVYFDGLGNVTPLATVSVKSRVDGELINVLYQEGNIVHQGDLLMEIDPRPFQVQLTQAEGQLAKDQAALQNARTDLARYETLLTQNAIPEQQVATQRSTVIQDEATVKSDQGQIDSAKLNLTYSHITAPITGRLGLRLVDSGNIVHAADSNGLVVITQVEPISVLFTIAEDQLPVVLKRLRAGEHLVVDAYDRELKQKLAQGTLTTVDNQIDQTTGTVRLRATFDNQDSALFPNQFVNARLLVEEKRGVILLPSAAIQRSATSTFVYLVQPDSSVTVRNITEGVTEGDNSEITSGLKAGDTVVLTGADRLQEGSRVRAHAAEDGQRKRR